MRKMLHDILVSIRMLRRNPGLTTTVLLTLAIGIGANTATFTMVYATLLAPLPYPHPEQLVMVWSESHNNKIGASTADYLDWTRQATAFQALWAETWTQFNMAGKDQPELVLAQEDTPGISKLGYPLMMGRNFLPEEGVTGHDHVVVITHKLWQKLGSNPNIIGTTLRLDDEPYTVIGVYAPGLYDRQRPQVFVPLAFKPDQIARDIHSVAVIGRLKPGVTIQQAQQDMNTVTARLAQMYPKDDEYWGAFVEPFKNDLMPKQQIKMLWLLLGAVGFVLLIACVNVANLLLARGVVRQKELAVRTALGAARRTLFAQYLMESLLLSLGGGALGVGFGYAMLKGLIAAMPQALLRDGADLRLSFPVLLFTLAAAVLSGLLAGCVPAWHASRADPGEMLKEGGRAGTGAGKHRLRRILVVGETALALVLLAGAGLTIHSFWNMAHVNLGVKTDHVLTFYLPQPDTGTKDPATVAAYYRDILNHIDAVPGVTHAAVHTGGLPFYWSGGTWFTLDGGPNATDTADRPGTTYGVVTPDYFKTFGIQIESGRAFTDQDTADSVPVAMVNQEFVKEYLRGKDPLLQRVNMTKLGGSNFKWGALTTWHIVGIYHDVHSADQRVIQPQILLPLTQNPLPYMGFGVRTTEDPMTMVRSISAAVHAVDPTVPLADLKTLDDVRDNTVASEQLTLILLVCFASLALFLAALGIYGVMSFSVAQRAHEIALRMALGASRDQVVTLVLRDGVILAVVGTAIGLVGAYFVGRTMHAMLLGVGALDLSAFLSVAAVLLAAAVLACLIPARRAASVEPMSVLRTE